MFTHFVVLTLGPQHSERGPLRPKSRMIERAAPLDRNAQAALAELRGEIQLLKG